MTRPARNVEVEIRPESPISSTWRVYAVPKDGYQTRPLRAGGRLLGGSFRQAYQDAEMLERPPYAFDFRRPL